MLPCTLMQSESECGDAVSVGWPAEFYTCPFWPVRAVERYQGPFNKTLANKVMVVSNTVRGLSLLRLWRAPLITFVQFDPITPLAEAEAVTALLGDNARLVQQHAFGVSCDCQSTISCPC